MLYFIVGIILIAAYFIVSARAEEEYPVTPGPTPEPPASPSPPSPDLPPDQEPGPEDTPNTPFPDPTPEPEPEPGPEEPAPEPEPEPPVSDIPENKFGIMVTGLPAYKGTNINLPGYSADWNMIKFGYFLWGDVSGGKYVAPDGYSPVAASWDLYDEKVFIFDLQDVLTQLPVNETGKLSGTIYAFHPDFVYAIDFQRIFGNEFLPKGGKLYVYNISESNVRLI